MSLFAITASEARELMTNSKPYNLALTQALDDSFNIIRGDAKRGQKTSVQRIIGEREKLVPQIKIALEEAGFAVAINKDEKSSSIISISWM